MWKILLNISSRLSISLRRFLSNFQVFSSYCDGTFGRAYFGRLILMLFSGSFYFWTKFLSATLGRSKFFFSITCVSLVFSSTTRSLLTIVIGGVSISVPGRSSLFFSHASRQSFRALHGCLVRLLSRTIIICLRKAGFVSFPHASRQSFRALHEFQVYLSF